MFQDRPPLPSNRAFVIQLHAEAQGEQGQWYGRVEHITSHQTAHFQSLDELLAFMVRTITTSEQTEAELPLENEA
jgi:hypothetical protein